MKYMRGGKKPVTVTKIWTCEGAEGMMIKISTIVKGEVIFTTYVRTTPQAMTHEKILMSTVVKLTA